MGGGGEGAGQSNSPRPAREGGRVVRGQSEFILFRPPHTHHTHTDTFTAAVNSVGWVGEGGSPYFLPTPFPYLHSCS